MWLGATAILLAASVVLAADDPPSFISLHTPDHKRLSVNAGEISSVREPRAGQYGPGVKCVVVMANRSFIGVAETCHVVHELLGVPRSKEHEPCTLVCAGTARP